MRAPTFFALIGLLAACTSDDVETPAAASGMSTSVGAGGSGGDRGGNGGATTGGGEGGGVGGTGGAGGEIPLGPPITAPNQEWTWVDFPTTACANGVATGIGVNLSDASPNAVIFLQGGGACWDEATCHTTPTSVNLATGFGEGDLAAAHANYDANSVFDRSDMANPFRDWSYVFVPYCTGDFHAGTNVADHGGSTTHHVGYLNMTAYLNRLVPTFAGASHIVLTGSSAGAYGAGFNYHRTALAFSPQRVDLINDGAPFVSEPIANAMLEATWRAAWDLDAIMPSDCTTCLTKLYGLELHGIEQNPNSRAALMSHSRDGIIGLYFQLNGTQMAFGHVQLAVDVYNPHTNASYFVIDGTVHTMWANPSLFSQGGVGLWDWITQMVTDDPTWASLGPP